MTRRSCLLVVLALLAIGCSRREEDAKADFRASVATTPVREGRIERLLSTTGNVRAESAAKAVAESGGKLTLARDSAHGGRLAIGDRVRKGQLIAVLAADELATTARLEAKAQSLRAAKAEYERNKQLATQGLLSVNQMAEMETRLANAQAENDAAVLQYSKARLVAPIDGIITSILTAPDGEFIAERTTIAEVMRFDEVIVDLDLGATDILAIQPGVPARVSVPGTDVTVDGVIARVSPAIDTRTRTFRTEVRVLNGDGRLRPGMFVRVDVVLEARDGVLLVPARSVVARDGRPHVFIVDAQRARAKPVGLGLVTEVDAEIVEGVTAGQRVVTSGQETLGDDVAVIVRE